MLRGCIKCTQKQVENEERRKLDETGYFIFRAGVYTQCMGGTRLHDDFGYNVDGDDIGECWGIAAHQNGNCTVTNGDFKGEKLSKLWDEHRELFGNAKGVSFHSL